METKTIKAIIQLRDKSFEVTGEITNTNLSAFEIKVTKVMHGNTDITEYYTFFDDSEKFEFALKEAYYKNMMKTAKEKITEASEILNDYSRFFSDF